MDATRISRQNHRQVHPGLRFCGSFLLGKGRVHEFCGGARRRLALWLARAMSGPVIWIRPSWHPDRLHMAGVAAEIAPGRLIFVEPTRAADLLWSMEEALRSGEVPLVVGDLPDPPGLTPVRRLHLSAEAGAEVTGHAPLGLLLTPGQGGAPGVETRWRLDPAHDGPEHASWRLERLRARSEPPGTWSIGRDAGGAPTLMGATRSPEPA